MNKSDIETYLKRIEAINAVIKQEDDQTNKENVENIQAINYTKLREIKSFSIPSSRRCAS